MCEDLVKFGSYFIVVWYKGKFIYVLLDKINLFKGIRIKYRIEDLNESFDLVVELIYYCVVERKLLF